MARDGDRSCSGTRTGQGTAVSDSDARNTPRSNPFSLKRRTRLNNSIVLGSNAPDSFRASNLFSASVPSRDVLLHLVGQQQQHQQQPKPSSRRYNQGEHVLIADSGNNPSTVDIGGLVNRFGYPFGEGSTPDERRGPYQYILATVKQVHFEEIHPFYTVTRADNGRNQRANAPEIWPILTERAELLAARLMARRTSSHSRPTTLHHTHSQSPHNTPLYHHYSSGASGGGGDAVTAAAFGDHHHHHQADHSHHHPSVRVPRGAAAWLQSAIYYASWPLVWIDDVAYFVWMAYLSPVVVSCCTFVRQQSQRFLYGREPYICRLRLTAVNFIVLCSTTFMFIDHFRLAFLPPWSDHIVAGLCLGIWVVLVLELVFEVFIRPDGYQNLIISDKAYAPITVRYINFFHLMVESISLALFVPEFTCIFSGASCTARLPFSIFNALLLSVVGSNRQEAFYGHAFIALTRLRVFGLVRHWKNMWITRTFINRTWHPKQSGILSNIVPPSIKSRRNSFSRKHATESSKEADPDDRERSEALTNASSIGTALMATNSYRALAIVWAVVGLFPVVISISASIVNDVGRSMTYQLQATNLIATDTSNESCMFLVTSASSWLAGVSNRRHVEDSPYLLSLDVLPVRCRFDSANLTRKELCRSATSPAKARMLCDNWSRYLDGDSVIQDLAAASGIREGSIVEHNALNFELFTSLTQNGSICVEETTYSVLARFDESFSIRTA
jgi:hypothetical protein